MSGSDWTVGEGERIAWTVERYGACPSGAAPGVYANGVHTGVANLTHRSNVTRTRATGGREKLHPNLFPLP